MTIEMASRSIYHENKINIKVDLISIKAKSLEIKFVYGCCIIQMVGTFYPMIYIQK